MAGSSHSYSSKDAKIDTSKTKTQKANDAATTGTRGTFTLVSQDITKMRVGAIVNAANTDLRMGSGVCGAIFKAAGEKKLQAACDKLSPIRTGEAVITPGFELPAKYVIHTAGPVYDQWSKQQSETLLRSCYTGSLSLAAKNKCNSIAFPLISSGIYGYPKKESLTVAASAIADWLKEGELDVYLSVFDKEALDISEELLTGLESYIDENYVGAHKTRAGKQRSTEKKAPSGALGGTAGKRNETFSAALLRLIGAKGKKDVDVYKKANIGVKRGRKLFSKIRTTKGHTPSKRTVIALAVALELTLPETTYLLERAGFPLSHSQMFDVIVEYFIVNGKYNIFEINEVLFKYDQPLLGG
jgi:O-acetyl-ADP-ribose deacetylase (regulator of RNase III)